MIKAQKIRKQLLKPLKKQMYWLNLQELNEPFNAAHQKDEEVRLETTQQAKKWKTQVVQQYQTKRLNLINKYD